MSSKHPQVTHDAFVDAVVDEFRKTYQTTADMVDVDEAYLTNTGGEMNDLVIKEIAELKVCFSSLSFVLVCTSIKTLYIAFM